MKRKIGIALLLLSVLVSGCSPSVVLPTGHITNPPTTSILPTSTAPSTTVPTSADTPPSEFLKGGKNYTDPFAVGSALFYIGGDSAGKPLGSDYRPYPGGEIDVPFWVHNGGDEGYTVEMSLLYNNSGVDISSWLSYPKTKLVPAGTNQLITVTMKIPSNTRLPANWEFRINVSKAPNPGELFRLEVPVRVILFMK